MKKAICGIFIGLLLGFWTGAAPAQAGVIGPELKASLHSLSSEDEVPVIIRFTDKVDPRQFRDPSRKQRRFRLIRALKKKADLDQREARSLLTGQNARRLRQLWLINGLAVKVPVSMIEKLSRLPGVEKVTLDREIRHTVVSFYCGISSAGWNIEVIRASELWGLGHDGTGVVVATMDTGVDANHPDIGPSYRGGNNSWFDPNGQHATPYDANGHGTQVMGVIVGGDTSGTPIGVAPGARWIAVKIFDDSDVAELSDIHAGFQWLLDPDGNPETDDAPDIVNHSWVLGETTDQCNTEFQEDIAALKAADIAVVFAAGNTGPDPATSVSPSNDPKSMAVGAAGEALGTLMVSDFSARGPSACDGGVYPRVTAPGAHLMTTDLTFGGIFFGSYICANGTSFAAPHVSGAMALLKGAMESRGMPTTVLELESAIQAGAMDMGEPGPDNEWGAGFLDVLAAYHWLEENSSHDADGDGYPADVDCNDDDPDIHPGADEVEHDGVDQDCNGYDLTVDITRARYVVSRDKLIVQATSDLADQAALKVAVDTEDGRRITRIMYFKVNKDLWQRTINDFQNRFGSRPISVTVFGPEGRETAPVQLKQ